MVVGSIGMISLSSKECAGFFVGNFASEIILFSSLNIVILFLILMLVTLLVHKLVAFDILIELTQNYHQFKEFLEWKRNKTPNQ
jgi:hypothetical protein